MLTRIRAAGRTLVRLSEDVVRLDARRDFLDSLSETRVWCPYTRHRRTEYPSRQLADRCELKVLVRQYAL